MTDTINPVRGRAVYLEFIKPTETVTTQILVMPEGMTTSHKVVPMTVFRRRISEAQPRKTWKMSSAGTSSQGEIVTLGPDFSEDVVAARMLSFLTPLFRSLQMNNYQLFKQPIVIEVTAEDLELARLGKTPYKAMARVWKSRKAFGFPKEYLHVPTPASF